jgi:hypothetical protein
VSDDDDLTVEEWTRRARIDIAAYLESVSEDLEQRKAAAAVQRRAGRLILIAGYFALVGNAWVIYDKVGRRDWIGAGATVPVIAVLLVTLWMVHKTKLARGVVPASKVSIQHEGERHRGEVGEHRVDAVALRAEGDELADCPTARADEHEPD